MCARFEINHARMRRGMKVPVIRDHRADAVKWTGFARAERLDWWRKKGAEMVDIPAERFAECSCVSEDLIWADLQPGEVILGLVVQNGDTRSLRVVTRDPTPEEMLHFQAFRVPVVVHEEDGDVETLPVEEQPELFE